MQKIVSSKYIQQQKRSIKIFFAKHKHKISILRQIMIPNLVFFNHKQFKSRQQKNVKQK